MAVPDALVALQRYRAQLERQDAAALSRLIDAYGRIYGRLENEIALLVRDIADKEPTRGQVARMARYQSLLKQTADELSAFGVILRDTVDQAAVDSITLGEMHARALVSEILVGNGSIAAQFNALPREAIESLLGFLAPESPLYKRINDLSRNQVDLVSDTILEGVGIGKNPNVIGRQLRGVYGRGLTDALRLTRTVQLYSYREANRASYVANSDVVDGWIWHAKLDSATCMSCVVQHGTWHPLSETLNDHHNGRCAMLPSVRGLPDYGIEAGREWFENQDEQTQKQMLGAGRWQAWREGQFALEQLTTTRDDEVYGEMRVEAPLKALTR